MHYLDDYLWLHKHYIVCLSTCRAVQDISSDIGLPLAPDKFIGPAQSLEFLGLTIDTVRMAVAILPNKSQTILKEVEEILACSKCRVKKVQSLVGLLNFITRAVQHGRPFSWKMYNMIAGIKPHWHINITQEVKRDLVMWKRFILDYGGWTPIIMPTTPVLHLFMDVATTVQLGWGAWWGTAWTYDNWDPQYM